MADYLEENGNHRLRESDKDGVKFLYPFPGERRKSSVDSFEGTGIHEIVLCWLFKEGKIRRDPADSMHAPKIEKKVPVILTVDEVTKLLEQPSGANPKEIRDKAMLELLYATGIRVTEL